MKSVKYGTIKNRNIYKCETKELILSEFWSQYHFQKHKARAERCRKFKESKKNES